MAEKSGESIRIVLATLALTGAGCATTTDFFNRMVGKTSPQEVKPDQFVQPRQSVRSAGPNPVDQPGGLSASNPRLGDAFQPALPPLPAPSAAPEHLPLDKTLTSAEPPVAVTSATQPATTQPEQQVVQAPPPMTEPSLSTGEYMPLGGVVAEVNGTPIYVNKVLKLIWPSLKNDASQMDADHFALAARDLIYRQIQNLIRDELLFAAAQRTLDDSDKKLVSALTAAYRQKEVTKAGGSIEVARRNAIAAGDDFDQKVQDTYRELMMDVYRQRKFSPFLEPSAAELRRYYQENVNAMFTEHPEAVFDLLGINPALLSGPSEVENRKLAFDKAKQAHDRAAAGEKFATIFSEYNNDPGLVGLTSGTGNVGSMQRGSFNIKEIEDAVWSLPPGKVTDVIEVNGELYVAKMESRKEGLVHSFEDQDVQATISNKIKSARFEVLLQQEDAKLRSQAIVRTVDEMVNTALDMAMQNYAVWNKK